MYNTGVYGGTFSPLHMGHLACIINAANMCKKLYVVINHSENPDEINIRIRHRWVHQLTNHIGNVDVVILSDTFRTRDKHKTEIEKDDTKFIKNRIGENVDVVFCSDKSAEDDFLCDIYPSAPKHIFEDGTIKYPDIKDDIYGNWDMLPNVVKPYYVKKVLLVGSSSTGKSTLTRNLANLYNTNCIGEESREHIEEYGHDALFIPEDFTKILIQHKLDEINALKTSNKVLFVDTDALVTRFYMSLFGDPLNRKNEILADAISDLGDYDLILFLEPDVPFVHDGFRGELAGDRRLEYSKQIKQIMDEHGKEYICINGDYHQRFVRAVEAVNSILR